MTYDNKPDLWGIEKLVGFGLLYGVRIFSLVLLYLLKTQDPMSLFLFTSTMECDGIEYNLYNVNFYNSAT